MSRTWTAASGAHVPEFRPQAPSPTGMPMPAEPPFHRQTATRAPWAGTPSALCLEEHAGVTLLPDACHSPLSSVFLPLSHLLSTLSSFLPTTFTERLNKLTNDAPSQQGLKDALKASKHSNKKHKKQKLSLNEAHLHRRPPAPAKSNHPLNLPLQLVPTHASRDLRGTGTASSSTAMFGKPRFSVDLVPDHDATPPLPSPSTSDSNYALRPLQRLRLLRVQHRHVLRFQCLCRLRPWHGHPNTIIDAVEVWFNKDGTPHARVDIRI
ncbi:hypothetical protein JB92DRAFT_3105942 [Gautieria morchelliformis]|nr:hypothetical protein JB92DRAFT_3105942 [Gautieria morchelliformis]